MYYLIVRVTGLNIGLIAIVVGLMVGGGVRTGSGNRGGRFYQLLAVCLTYSSIVAMNAPFMIEAMYEQWKQNQDQNHAAPIGRQQDQAKVQVKSSEPAATNSTRSAPKVSAAGVQKAGHSSDTRDLATQKKDPAAREKPVEQDTPPSLAGILLALAIFGAVLFAGPVLEAVHAPIAGLIYAFALWEAWKINKKVHLTFNGPFRVSASSESAAPPEVVGDGA